MLARFFCRDILQVKGGILSYFIPFLLCTLVLCVRINVVVVAIRMIALDKQVPAPRERIWTRRHKKIDFGIFCLAFFYPSVQAFYNSQRLGDC
jgi:hypothetical protein